MQPARRIKKKRNFNIFSHDIHKYLRMKQLSVTRMFTNIFIIINWYLKRKLTVLSYACYPTQIQLLKLELVFNCINSICPYFYLKHSDQVWYQELCLLMVGISLLLLSVKHFLLSFEMPARHFLLLWHLSQNKVCCFLHHTNFVLFLQVPSNTNQLWQRKNLYTNLSIFQINFISKYYEREVVWISWTCLN